MGLRGTMMHTVMTVLSTVGHLLCIFTLVFAAFWIKVIETIVHAVVGVVSSISGASISQDSLQPHKERVRTFQTNPSLVHYREGTGSNGGTGPNQVVDEPATLSRTQNLFPLTEKELIAKCHQLICSEFGGLKPELLAEDFQFLFPVVGPLHKKEFVHAFTSFRVHEAFPDSRANFYNFHVDPLEPNRIWCLSRGHFRHTGTLSFGPSKYPATQREICLPPQCFSMSFDEKGQCYKLTGGYCVDRAVGDTKGLGGMFGILNAIGGTLPFPEGRPWQRSLMWEAFPPRLPQILKDWKVAP